ncbi:MAG: hypothetical protein NTW06_02530 [Candidatus Falkowbacteria bacterium]|nr:hypothetical protein [Candidatus Falkowbacteria bacterium]
MAENILPKTSSVSTNVPEVPNKHNTSVIGIILAFFLFIALVMLGERIIFDLNRVANPAIQKATNQSSYNYGSSNSYQSYIQESSELSSVKIYYKNSDKSTYRAYKLLIHSAFIIPAFLLVFLFYYLFIIKNKNLNLKVVIFAYFAFAFWMLFHLLGELGKYIIDEYENLAVYIILGILVIIFTILAFFIQKKFNHREELKS